MKYLYIRRKDGFIEFDTQISEELNGNDLGTTWQDYLNNKFVLLNDEQQTFREEHPNANIKEVFNMQLTPTHIRTLEEAKNQMNAQIRKYDASSNVNSFDVIMNGEVIATSWLTPAERSNYRSSIDAAELTGLTELSLYIGEIPVTLPTQQAKLILAKIQLYADACYIVTKEHLSTVEALGNIEDVDAYNYQNGYPPKLSFEL